MKMFRRKGGFTLIELLVVILILAILMAIALPLYLAAVARSERQTCRTNMQTIANAEQAYKVRSVGHVYTSSLTDLIAVDPISGQQDLQSIPQCPSDDGTTDPDYSVTLNADGTFTVTCLVDGTHGTFTPGVDAQ
jgi:type IV pilus assembly protein PilA